MANEERIIAEEAETPITEKESIKNERTAKLAALRVKAGVLVKDYNEANQTGDLTAAARISKDLDETIGDYTDTVRLMCFDECKDTENPMLTAVKMLSFMTIATRDEKAEGSDIPVRVIVDRERQIDLLKLHNHCGGIGADKKWADIAQKMNFLLTAQKAIDLGLDPKEVNDSYAMSQIAQQIDMGKNPTSKTNMLRTLNMVIQAMLGDGYKATSHDVNYLMSVYSRKNRRALTVSCATHRNFRNYMAEVCHRIVTGAKYDLDYRKKK